MTIISVSVPTFPPMSGGRSYAIGVEPPKKKLAFGMGMSCLHTPSKKTWAYTWLKPDGTQLQVQFINKVVLPGRTSYTAGFDTGSGPSGLTRVNLVLLALVYQYFPKMPGQVWRQVWAPDRPGSYLDGRALGEERR